jgi:Spy/CpxP family protein refolding chaperone
MKKSTREQLEAILKQEREAGHQQLVEALDLVGAFYDELLSAFEHLPDWQYRQERQAAVKELQSRFYRLCGQAGVSVLTPRQRQAFQRGKEETSGEQS